MSQPQNLFPHEPVPIRPRQIHPAELLPPTGTHSPAPRPAYPRQPRPDAIPYNVAFREVLEFVTRGLKDMGEQWTDQAKQDAICTILIAAQKQHLLTVWER